MINKLSIKNFKSIKDVEIECKKINVFIGEPNTGKSNILEALGLLSWCGHSNANLSEFIRFKAFHNLFYDELIENHIEISIENKQKPNLSIKFEIDHFKLTCTDLQEHNIIYFSSEFDFLGKNIQRQFLNTHIVSYIKFYRFAKQDKFEITGIPYFLPPDGSNLFSVAYASKELRNLMTQFFKPFGFSLVFKPQDKTFEIQKQVDDLVFSYPYITISDTLQRIIFHTIAIESNQNSTLIFEEHEAHAFPYYTKYLGEKIAFDETNQFFIATHNPYLLNSILEKSSTDSVNIFITYFKNFETKIKCLTDSQKQELMNYDPFFKQNSFIEMNEGKE
jgi:AAA15 family ATPase/GTPase